FPRAGTPNAKSVLKMVTFRLQKASPTTVLDYYHEGSADAPVLDSDSTEVTDIRWYELRTPLKEAFPWFEYLARVGWTPCGKFVWVQLLDRKQQRLELALIPVEQFSTPVTYENAPPHLRNPSPVAKEPLDQKPQDIQVLISESAPDAWINVHDILHFLPSAPGEASFVWASEETGHLHLYLVTCAINRREPACDAPGEASFVWASEETGHLHLYLVTCAINRREPACEYTILLVSPVLSSLLSSPLSCPLPSPASAPGEASFVWASEETGHLHLYLVTCAINRREPASVLDMITDEGPALGPHILSREPITAGDWEIMGRKIWVDEARQLVYFLGLRETPLERHLYAAPYNPPRPHAPTLLTTVGHSCAVDIDEDCTTAVVTSSSISSVPRTRVYRLAHSPPRLHAQGTLLERAESPETRSFNGSWDSRSGDGDDTDCSDTGMLIRENSLSVHDIPPAQIFTTRLSCGAPAYCSLWRCARPGRSPTVLHVYGGPEVQTVTNSYKHTRLSCGAPAYCSLWRCARPGRSPTVLHVYGGPEVQTVTNSYKGIRQLRMHMLAARGFNVVAVDSRGSKHRGRAWEAAIKGKMGQVELDDQVEVLQWLAKETGCIDMERIAIHGWSYGGYLSLLGLATRPNIFKVCVAGAPVTSWRLYDTAYTERYMGLPCAAPHAYTRASVLAHAPFFPDQEGRLLIIHGLADENVHFCHTAALLAELVRLGKPHRVQIYPGERHSLRAVHAAKHYEAALLHFLHEHL
ncbi:dipeptidyl peptidase 9-like, partial [Ostrinia furnacalis]|uniref:dipeptidyl peptidase 9-like n=1 Tax=Ostrinia furnacalis TaxID=93504 RepID=UPI00103FA756